MRAPDSDTAIAHLAACPLFADLSPARLARLAVATTERRHANGGVIHHKGDLPAALLVVQSGRIKETCLSPEGDEASSRFSSRATPAARPHCCSASPCLSLSSP